MPIQVIDVDGRPLSATCSGCRTPVVAFQNGFGCPFVCRGCGARSIDGTTWDITHAFERTTTMVAGNEDLQGAVASGITNASQAAPRTVAVVATELQNAMDAASRVPRLRAELDALLGVVRRVRKVAK